MIVSASFGFANFLTRRKSRKSKTIVGSGIYAFFILLTLYLTRSVVIHLDGTPERVSILTNVEGEPEIHSNFRWKKHIEADSTFVIRTSSPGFLLEDINFDLKDKSGKNIGGRGTTTTYGTCGNNALIISLQTIYLDFDPRADSTDTVNFQALKNEQQKVCESLN
ncbi:MAG: hypothetical protein RIB54_21370 [Fulvivirga sp.]